MLAHKINLFERKGLKYYKIQFQIKEQEIKKIKKGKEDSKKYCFQEWNMGCTIGSMEFNRKLRKYLKKFLYINVNINMTKFDYISKFD